MKILATKPKRILDVEVRRLDSLRAVHKTCLFRQGARSYDRTIRAAFQDLRERVTVCGLDPDTLLHVGIPEIIEDNLVSYDCCIEFPIPAGDEMCLRTLPGGLYTVLTVEKILTTITPAIREFCVDYLPDHELVPDEGRPIYEIYFKDYLEFCIPIHKLKNPVRYLPPDFHLSGSFLFRPAFGTEFGIDG